MDDKIRELFPWFPTIKRRFLKTLCSDYEPGMLEELQQNVAQEIEELEKNYVLKRAKLLLECIEFFYYHFCRIWSYRKEVSSHLFVFSSPMMDAWIHMLASIIKLCLFRKKSICIRQVLIVITKFPGDKNMLYSALLAVYSVNRKYWPAYEEILRHVLIFPLPSFVPVRMDNPAEFLRMYLLLRRVKIKTNDPTVKAELMMRASKILAPASLKDWLLAHNFIVPWTKKGIKKVNLAVNISRKLEADLSQKEVVQALRKILLPDICTKSTVVQRRPCGKNSSEDEYDSNNVVPGWSMRIPPLVATTSDDGNVKTNKKKRKKRKLILLKENHSCKTEHPDDFFHENGSESIKLTKKQRKQKLKHEAGKIQDQANNEYSSLLSDGARKKQENKKSKKENVTEKRLDKDSGEHSCVLNSSARKERSGEHSCVLNSSTRKERKSKKSKKDHQSCFMDSNDFESEPVCKKRKREKVISEKSSDKLKATSGDHSLISQTVKIKRRKAKKLDTNSKVINDIPINNESNVDLPVIVDEINVEEPVSKEKAQMSKSIIVDCASSYSDDDQPVNVKEVKNCFGSISCSLKSKDTKTELNLNTEAERKIVDEDIFTIDSKPSPCFSESGIAQIKYESMYDFKEADAMPFENTNNFNSSFNLREDVPTKFNSRLKITNSNCAPGEIEVSDISLCQTAENISNDLNLRSTLSPCDTQEQISEKDIGTFSDSETDTSVIRQSHEHDKRDNVASSGMEKYSDSQAENIKESSQDSDVQFALENRFSQSSIDSPLKTAKTSLQNVDAKISSPVRENLESEKNNCSIELKKEPLLEHSMTSLTENNVPRQSVLLTTNIASEETVTKEKLMADSNMANKIKSVVDSDSSNSLEVDTPEKETDNADIDVHSLSQKTSIEDCPMSQVFDVKSPVLKTECAPEDSETVTSCQILNDVTTPNNTDKTLNISAVKGIVKLEKSCTKDEFIKQNIEGDPTSALSQSAAFLVKSTSANKSPQPSFLNISAENVNKNKSNPSPTSEFLQYRDLSSNQEDSGSEGSLSESKSIIKTEPSECPSDVSNDTEDEESNSASDCSSSVSSSGTSNSKKSVKTEYSWDDTITRQRFSKKEVDKHDTMSSHSPSEVTETDLSTCTSTHDAVPRSSNSKINCDAYDVKNNNSCNDSMTRPGFCKEEYNGENDTRNSVDNQTNNSTKTMILKGLNPIVNLGVRCDSKGFIAMNSMISADSLNIPATPCVQSDSRTANGEINGRKPSVSNLVPSTVDLLLTQLNETAEKVHAYVSNMEAYEETAQVDSDVKMQIQPGHTELCIAPYQQTVSPEVQEPPFKLKSEKESTQHPEDTVYDEGLELTETRQSSEHSLGMKLRKRNVPEVQTHKSLPVDKVSSALNQDTFVDHCMHLRNRNPSKSSIQEKSLPEDEVASELNPDSRTADGEINEAKHSVSNVPSTVDLLLTQLNETAEKVHAYVSNMETYEETAQVNSDVKMQIQPGHTELCIAPDEQNVSHKDQEPLFKLKSEKERTQHPEDSVYDKGQELTETRKGSKHYLGMKLRKINVPAIQTQKSLPVNEGSSALNQDTSATHRMHLRNKNPSMSSSLEKSLPEDEVSGELKQDISANQRMHLRNRNPSTSSSLEKSLPEDEVASELKQDISANQRMHLRNRNPSTSSGVEKSLPDEEDSIPSNQHTSAINHMHLRSRNPSSSSSQGKSSLELADSSAVSQNTPVTQCMNLRSKNPTTSSRKVVKRASQTVAKRSSKRLKKEVNLNLNPYFSELSLNSPKVLRSRPHDSSYKNCPEDPKDDAEPSTSDQGNPRRRVTRASVITSTADQSKKEQNADPESYNLRSKRSVIMPGKLQL